MTVRVSGGDPLHFALSRVESVLPPLPLFSDGIQNVHVRKVRLFVSTIAVESMDDRSGVLQKGIREATYYGGRATATSPGPARKR